MAGIKNLKQIQSKKGDDFLNNLLNNFVIINENIDGTFFGVKKSKADKFSYFKKSGEITYVDRMMMKYYNPAIAYFETMDAAKKERIPANFYFGFEYISRRDKKAANFARAPKNNLVLSYIHRLGDDGKPVETLQTKDDLDRWAYYLEVEAPPIIFEGKLDDEQKSAILEFVYSPESELEEKFKTTSFTKHIISVLNPESKESMLRKGSAGDIDSIIFRFYDEEDENAKANAFLAKLVDPMFRDQIAGNEPQKNKSNDYIWLIVIDLMNKIEMYSEDELRKITDGESDYDNKYLALVNRIFKDFIKDYSYKYEGLKLEVPEYLQRPEFEIEFDMINDEEVVKLIKGTSTYKEIYRILVNFFRKTRKRTTSSFFNPDLLTQLNIQIKKIKRVVMGDVLYEGLFPSFGEYVGDTSYDQVYVGEHEHFKNNKKGNVKSENVNVLIGTFQPIHNGHIKAAQKLMETNGLKCVLVAIVKKNKKYPFSERTVRILLEKTQQENHDLFQEVRVVTNDTIKGILSNLRPHYNPVSWGASKNKINDYVLQFDHIKKKDIPMRISDDFKLVEIPSFQKSADVLASIESGNFASFKDQVPVAITSEFFNLQKELEFLDK